MALLSARLRRRLSALGWSLLRLSRAGGGKAVGTLSVWQWWNAALHRWRRLEAPRPGAMVRYRRETYHGKLVVLGDGTVVRPGDPILELHIDSQQVLDLGVNGLTPWQRLKAGREDMHALAELVAAGALGPVVALHGETLVEGIPRLLGFEIYPLPHTWRWGLFRYFMIGMEAIYHPSGLERLDRPREDRWPVECWLSREGLLRKHGRRRNRAHERAEARGDG